MLHRTDLFDIVINCGIVQLYNYSVFQVSFVDIASKRFDVCCDRLPDLVCYILWICFCEQSCVQCEVKFVPSTCNHPKI